MLVRTTLVVFPSPGSDDLFCFGERIEPVRVQTSATTPCGEAQIFQIETRHALKSKLGRRLTPQVVLGTSANAIPKHCSGQRRDSSKLTCVGQNLNKISTCFPKARFERKSNSLEKQNAYQDSSRVSDGALCANEKVIPGAVCPAAQKRLAWIWTGH